MPETVNMLAQIIEFEKTLQSLVTKHCLVDKKVVQIYLMTLLFWVQSKLLKQVKVMCLWLVNIAAQNLTYNYIAQGNPSLYFANEPIAIKHK